MIIPVIHGRGGEDGSLQGLLELAGIPYVGSGVLGSAIQMDKDIAKRLLRAARLPVTPGVCVRAGQLCDGAAVVDALIDELGTALFVKPANQGSSVGISKVERRGDLLPALRDAARYDTKILVERAIEAREIEVALLGNDPIEASIPGEIRTRHAFYDYDAKYRRRRYGAADPGTHRRRTGRGQIRHLAIEAVVALEGAGIGSSRFPARSQLGRGLHQRGQQHSRFHPGIDVPTAVAGVGNPVPGPARSADRTRPRAPSNQRGTGDSLRTHAVAERPELIEPQLVDLDCRALDFPRRFGLIQVAIDPLEHRLQPSRGLSAERFVVSRGSRARVVELDRVRVVALYDQARVTVGQRHPFPRFGAASPMPIEMRDHGSRQTRGSTLG